MGAPEVDAEKAAGSGSNRPGKSDDSPVLDAETAEADPIRRRSLQSTLKGGIVRAVRRDCTEVAGEMAFDFSFSILWFGLAQAFGTYVSNFSYYNRVTGTLGGMIVFQLCIYLTALLLGGELNAELNTSAA